MEGAASASAAAGNGKRKELEDLASALMEETAGAAGTHKRLKRQLTQESDLKVEEPIVPSIDVVSKTVDVWVLLATSLCTRNCRQSCCNELCVNETKLEWVYLFPVELALSAPCSHGASTCISDDRNRAELQLAAWCRYVDPHCSGKAITPTHVRKFAAFPQPCGNLVLTLETYRLRY